MLNPPGNLFWSTTYQEFIQLTLVWNLAIPFLFLLPLLAIFALIFKYSQFKEKRRYQTLIDSQSQQQVVQPEQRLTRLKSISKWVFLVLYWIEGLIMVLILNSLNMFGNWGRTQILYVFLEVLLLMMLAVLQNKIVYSQFSLSIKAIVIFSLLASILVLTTSGFCLCFFNNYYGYHLGDKSISTSFSRLTGLNKPCNQNQPCHFFATIPQNGTNSVIFNLHTGLDSKIPTLTLTKISSSQQKELNFTKMFDQQLDFTNKRTVWAALVNNLQSDSEYQLYVSIDSLKFNQTTYKTPKDGPGNLIVFGGDIGMNIDGILLNSHIKQANLLVIGGDVAYDDGMLYCYYSWDVFFWQFEQIFKNNGRLVAMVFAVGNHDVGFNTYSNITNKKNQKNYFNYLPQQFLFENGTGIPPPLNRTSFMYFTFGNMMFVSLDSGYIYNHEEQISFIEKVSLQHPGLIKSAFYHNPIYPACYDESSTTDKPASFREALKWTSVFSKFSFKFTMQNHVHKRKRTKPLINSTEAANGVVYLGDGCWGVPEQTCTLQTNSTTNPKYQFRHVFENSGIQNHYWTVVSQMQQLSFKAIGKQGQVLDEFSIKV